MKSHFQFSNQERSGIFLLLGIIVVIQCLLWFKEPVSQFSQINESKLKVLRQEVDSLKSIKEANNLPKIYPFNPNFITDYKGYTLGMTNDEIDRLHQFRAAGQWINSKKQFQEVTKVSDSFLKRVGPYFKFPEWVSQNRLKSGKNNNYSTKASLDRTLTYNEKTDLNQATIEQLQKVFGVGEILSKRIITYRSQFSGGFYNTIELTEVFGLSPEVIDRITERFAVKTPREIKTVNLNTATRDDLVKIKYIDYELAKAIIETRTLLDGFSSFEELTKVEQFPVKKIGIIKLYLHL